MYRISCRSTITKCIEMLKHFENFDSLVCRKILSQASLILTEVDLEEVPLESTTTLGAVRKTRE